MGEFLFTLKGEQQTKHILVNFKANQVSYNTYAHTFGTPSDYKK